jgi:hypothetical protein
VVISSSSAELLEEKISVDALVAVSVSVAELVVADKSAVLSELEISLLEKYMAELVASNSVAETGEVIIDSVADD